MRWQLALMFRLAKKKRGIFRDRFFFLSRTKQTQSLIRETAVQYPYQCRCIGRISWMSNVISTYSFHTHVFYICASQIFAKYFCAFAFVFCAWQQFSRTLSEMSSALLFFCFSCNRSNELKWVKQKKERSTFKYISKTKPVEISSRALRIRHAQKFIMQRNPNETRQRSHHGVECRMCMAQYVELLRMMINATHTLFKRFRRAIKESRNRDFVQNAAKMKWNYVHRFYDCRAFLFFLDDFPIRFSRCGR